MVGASRHTFYSLHTISIHLRTAPSYLDHAARSSTHFEALLISSQTMFSNQGCPLRQFYLITFSHYLRVTRLHPTLPGVEARNLCLFLPPPPFFSLAMLHHPVRFVCVLSSFISQQIGLVLTPAVRLPTFKATATRRCWHTFRWVCAILYPPLGDRLEILHPVHEATANCES